jgi:hypothetical protein
MPCKLKNIILITGIPLMFTNSRICKEGFCCRLFMESNSEKKLVFALMLTEAVNMLDIGVYRYGLPVLWFPFVHAGNSRGGEKTEMSSLNV